MIGQLIISLKNSALKLAVKLPNRRLSNIAIIILLGYPTWRKLANFVVAKIGHSLHLTHIFHMPYQYTIEPTMGVCNLQCPMCPTGLGVPSRGRGKLMDFDEYKDIVDQIAPYAFRIRLYCYGESLLHPRIFDMIRYAHDKRIYVELSSHLNTFNQNMADQMVASGLDSLFVFFDGADQQTYEMYRAGGDLNKAIKHTQMVIDTKKRIGTHFPIILIQMIVTRFNEHQLEQVATLAKGMGLDFEEKTLILLDSTNETQVNLWLPSNRNLSHYNSDGTPYQYPCNELWVSMTINPDGGIVPCLWPTSQQHDFGNLSKASLREVWFSDIYASARKARHSNGKGLDGLETVCESCLGKPTYNPGNHLIEEIGLNHLATMKSSRPSH